MAEEVQIAGTEARGKIRNPLAPALLPFVTFGIYTLVWYYRINKELATMGRARNTEELGTSPLTSLMAVMFGWLILVPPFISFYNTWKRANAAERLTGQTGMEPGLGLVLVIFIAPVAHYILQRDLNGVLQAQAGGVAPQAAIPQAAPATSPPPPAPESAQPPPATPPAPEAPAQPPPPPGPPPSEGGGGSA
jgi:hypothetical protein